ncbi:MAG: MBL fold metallo-hydrolase [Deltaproteobacteria bacterium]|nr:MAG: MBL fold metallo-hydrolase [Deltaproteobacteria bacterium]TMB30573.1 MAG: MBL fold metallo-hydrolase [Deltaproteobacteria bacterium]
MRKPAVAGLAVERAPHGLRVRGTQLYVDPVGRTQIGFLAHARGVRATLPERTVLSARTLALLEASQHRTLRKAAPLPAAFGQSFALAGLRLSLHPAGHVLGSAQIRCESVDGHSLVYAADLGGFGERAPATAEACERLRCDVLVLRASYGHPRFSFPARGEALADLLAFVRATLAERRTPVVLAASLGGAQETMRALEGHEMCAHPAILRAAEVYRAQGVELPAASALGTVRFGQVVLLPADNRARRRVGEMGPYRTCLLSGRAAIPGFAEKLGVDRIVPLSDHAGFPDLVDYALESGASSVLTVHGHARDLADELRRRGVDSHPIGEPHRQLELFP